MFSRPTDYKPYSNIAELTVAFCYMFSQRFFFKEKYPPAPTGSHTHSHTHLHTHTPHISYTSYTHSDALTHTHIHTAHTHTHTHTHTHRGCPALRCRPSRSGAGPHCPRFYRVLLIQLARGPPLSRTVVWEPQTHVLL